MDRDENRHTFLKLKYSLNGSRRLSSVKLVKAYKEPQDTVKDITPGKPNRKFRDRVWRAPNECTRSTSRVGYELLVGVEGTEVGQSQCSKNPFKQLQI